MEGRGRRWLSEVALACLAGGVCLVLSTIDAAAAGEQVSLTAHLGYNGTIKSGAWMPVDVDVTNNGPAFEGTLQVEAGTGFNGGFPVKGATSGPRVLYQTPVSLTSGATKHLRTYIVDGQPGAINVEIIQSGRLVVSSQASAPNTLAFLIGVLSDQPAALSALASASPSGFTPGVVHLAPSDIADSAVILRAFDVIAIDDFSTDTLTSAQRTALDDYVRGGGALLIGTGASWHKTVAGLPSDIVPMQIGSSELIDVSHAMPGVGALDLATGEVSAGGAAWLAQGAQPLIVEQRVGDGSISLATFDWNQDPIASWSGTPDLLRQVLVRSAIGVAASANNGNVGAVVPVASRGAGVSQVLGILPALDLPTWWLIGGLIALYVLVVGPLNYLVLRAINRRALAWLTVPAIVLVASGAAYGSSVATKGRSVEATEVAVLHVTAGSERAYAETYTGILTPTRGDYQVDLAGPRPLVSPIYNYSAGPIPNSSAVDLTVDTTNNSLTLPGMTAFTLRGFATEAFVPAQQLVVDAQLAQGQFTGTVKNLSTVTFDDGVVIAGNSFQKFGTLAPGGTASFSFAPTVSTPFGGPPAYASIYPNSIFGPQGPSGSGSVSGSQRDGELKTAVLSTLVGGFKGFNWSTTPMVVAWSKTTFSQISVEGDRPQMFGETAVVMNAPVAKISAGALPAGVTTGRVVDIDGTMQQGGGPPGVVMMQKGSVTYEFAPPLAPGAHLSAVSISSANQFAGKAGPPGTGGTAEEAQIWDWSQNAWVDLKFQDPGTTLIPDSAVNPSSGMVRLKLSSSGGFMSGWLSLAGDVK